MHFCPKTLRHLYKLSEERDSLPFHRFSIQDQDYLVEYRNLSIYSNFGYINWGIFVIVANLITFQSESYLRSVTIAIGYLIHFSPVLLGGIARNSNKLKELVLHIIVLNLGMILLPMSQRIVVNILFIILLAILGNFKRYFYPLQLTMALITFNFFLMRGVDGETDEILTFIQNNWLFVITLITSILFLEICFMCPTMKLVRHIYFYKDM